jgi:drug/metabolite transporter (DMT)-like permease
MPEQKKVRTGLLLALFGGFLFTFDLPLLRMAALDTWTVIFTRGLLLFVSILAGWYLANQKTQNKVPFIAGAAGLAVMGTNAVANIALVGATMTTTTANVVLILALVPMLTAAFSRLLIKEPIHLATLAAMIFAFEGVGIVVWDSIGMGNYWGDVLAFICACCTAAAFTVIRASGKNLTVSLALGSLASALIAVTFFPLNLPGLLQTSVLGAPSWLWLALNGLIVIPAATALIANAPRFLPSADVSMFFLLETLLAPVWVWLVFQETPSWGVFVGGSVVVLTLIAHSLWRFYSTLQRPPRRARRIIRKISS